MRKRRRMSLYRVARDALAKNKTVLIMSVGGLIGKSLKVRLARTKGNPLIPAGGANKTRVEIWISSKYRYNQHEISFEAASI